MESKAAKPPKHDSSTSLTRPIVLIGLMGAGKSKIGRSLASQMGLRFSDSDDVIEAAAGMSIASIFELYGEPAFRDIEARCLADVFKEEAGVIATGGGAFMHDDTRRLIKENALSLWLKAEPATLASRISNTDTRPLLKDRNATEVLADLAAKRYPVYAEADLTVDTDGLSVSAAVNKVVDALTLFLDTNQAD